MSDAADDLNDMIERGRDQPQEPHEAMARAHAYKKPGHGVFITPLGWSCKDCDDGLGPDKKWFGKRRWRPWPKI